MSGGDYRTDSGHVTANTVCVYYCTTVRHAERMAQYSSESERPKPTINRTRRNDLVTGIYSLFMYLN